MHVATRTRTFTESVIRGMTRLAAQHDAINLAQGYPDFPAPTMLKEAAKEAENYRDESDHKHHQAFYFDLGELCVELALVLSSVAILTKRSGYWYGGMAIGLIGLVVVAMGFFAH